MNTQKNITPSLSYTLIITCLNTLISILPGMILIETKVTLTFPLITFIAYLFLCEFFQVFIRIAYKQGRTVAMTAYITKACLSILAIWIIATKFTFQYGVILLAYEVFQFLTFSDKYHYQDTLSYTLVNAFFRGIVFNLIISLSYPYTFKLLYLTPYLFSLVITCFGSLMIQQLYSYLEKNKTYRLIGFFSGLVLIGSLVFSFSSNKLNLIPLIVLISLILIIIFANIISKNQRKAELLIMISVLAALIIYYS